MKKVGVRYCGGCNPRYDRGAMVKRLSDKHPEWQVSNACEGQHYQLLLVVGGCPSCCAAYEQYHYDEIIKIWEDKDEIAD